MGALLIPASILLAATTTVAAADVSVRGKTCEVTCHFNSKRIAREALEVAEAAWPVASAFYGVEREPSERHVIHLYRRREAFDAACEKLDGREWPQSSGLTTSRGVVLVHVGGKLSSAVFGRHVLTQADRHLIAHEVTHVVGGQYTRSFSAHPAWLSEGGAEWVADQVLAGAARQRTIEEGRASTVQDLVRRDQLPGVEAILADRLGALSTQERYAVCGAFLEFAQEQRAASVARALAARGPRLSSARINGLFLASDEDEPLERLETEFTAFLATKQPRWHLGPGHFEAQAEDDWLQLAFTDARAIVWSAQPLPAHCTLSGGLSVPARGKPAVRVLFGHSLHWSDTGEHWRQEYHSVAFDANGVTLWRHVANSRGDGGLLREAELTRGVQRLEPGADQRFELRLDHASLAVTLDSESVLQWRFDDRASLPGHWGVATDAGGVGEWSELRALE